MHCHENCYPHAEATQSFGLRKQIFFSEKKVLCFYAYCIIEKSEGKLDSILLLLCVVSGLFTYLNLIGI